MKVDAKWLNGIGSSWPCRSFTNPDSKQIIRYTHSVSINVLVNHELNPIAFLIKSNKLILVEYVFLVISGHFQYSVT